MQSLRIDTGSIRLKVNDDESRVIEFNPNDLAFVERFYGLISDFEGKEKEYMQKIDILNQNTELDSYNIPKNMGESLALLKEICEFLRERIDHVFGKGTSQAAFGNANTLDMFEQFLNGITPYIQQSRVGKVEKYTGNRAQRRAAAKVMK
ncbi:MULTISPECIES: DUF6673 family protein [Dehalobacter]|uniref:DUF6673 family protein n=1 Tax=Dehalobacter TaxID=56112 RepID=UPI002586CD2F|nr:DUF6673 family protein [Dehalobacter sp.]MDJ0305392.1 hypothetical protein [Dehalobacter sp.]